MSGKLRILAAHRATLDQRMARACDLLRDGSLDFMFTVPEGETSEVRQWLAARGGDQVEALVYLAFVGLMQSQIQAFEADGKS